MAENLQPPRIKVYNDWQYKELEQVQATADHLGTIETKPGSGEWFSATMAESQAMERRTKFQLEHDLIDKATEMGGDYVFIKRLDDGRGIVTGNMQFQGDVYKTRQTHE